jgi:hypothetical protein
LKGFVEKVVLAGDNVNEVADTPWRVPITVKVNMDAAGGVGEPSGSAQAPDQLLKGVDVLAVGKDGANQPTLYSRVAILSAAPVSAGRRVPSLMTFQTLPSGALTLKVP